MTATAIRAFDAPEPAWIYDGTVMHARLKPLQHRFRYRVWSLFLDIDRVAEAVAAAPLLRHNRPGLVSFHDRDHGPADGGALRPYVDRLLAEAGRPAPARVFLLCYPRVFGHVFNPISVYYCYGAEGQLDAVIYEVRNTFGERHSYLCPVEEDERHDGRVRQDREKLFFVSPFLGFGLTYRFRLNDPAGSLSLRILERDEAGPVLAAAFHGERRPLTTAALVGAGLRVPFLGLKIVACIHWEALRLWLKGARLFPRPAPPPPVSTTPRRDTP